MFTQSNLDEFENRLAGAIQDDPENGIFRCRRDIFTDEELFELEIKHMSTAEQKPATWRRNTRPLAGGQAPWRARSPDSWRVPWRIGPQGQSRGG